MQIFSHSSSVYSNKDISLVLFKIELVYNTSNITDRYSRVTKCN